MRLLAALLFFTHFTAECSTFNFDGFANLSLTTSSSDTAKIRHLISQPHGVRDNEIGLYNSSIGMQLEWQYSARWQTVIQAALKDQEKHNLDTLTQLAFIRFMPTANWTLRAGRTGLDLFMMTEYRDIGYSFTHEHLPTEFYAIIPHQNIDGIDVRYKTPTSLGLLGLHAFVGRSTAPIVSDDNFYWNAELANIQGLTIDLERHNWLYRINYTQSKSGNENAQQKQLKDAIAHVPVQIWPSQPHLQDSLNIVGKQFNYGAIGVRYDNATWLIQSELSYINSNSEVLNHLRSGYFSIGKRFNQHTLMATASIAKSNNQVPEPPLISNPELDYLYQSIIRHTNFYLIDQNTLSLTWRMELNNTSALKVQIDHTNVQQLPSAFYLHKPSTNPDNRFNTLGISLNWVF